jgi:multidrug efflux pump subunit AcrB
MNLIAFAMKRPITIVVAVIAVVFGSFVALSRMKVDIFPNLNLPVVYVVQPYGGMDPAQMEALLTFHYENHFLYISGIHHIESRNIQGFSQMKVFFHPGTDMVQAMAEVVAQVNRSRSFMPPGTVAPFVVRFDAGSVPVGYIVLESQTKTIDEIQEAAYIRVRPSLVSLQGVSAPPPFGGNQRTIVLHVDPDKLRSYHLSPNDVVEALAGGNSISPSGNVRIQGSMPIVPVNAMVLNPQDLGRVPIRPGESLFLRDVVIPIDGIEDSSDIRTSFALVNGRRAVYMLVSKRADASTLAVVNRVKDELPKMQAALPEDIKLRFEFDQSPHVIHAMESVATEGAIGAVLTGLMVLLFLRDWRSVIVVVLTIPFSLLSSLVALWITGQTLNLMTLGGLALAIGILVDEATVIVENIHTHMGKAESTPMAVFKGTLETAVPCLLAMLCILAVFIPAFTMEGAAREMFVPLSLAVGFAMIASYLLGRTFVPVLCAWLLPAHADHGETAPEPTLPGRFSFDNLRLMYARFLEKIVRGWGGLLVPFYLLGAALIVWQVGGQRGTEIFPQNDSGQFQLRLRAPEGTRIERTEEISKEALNVIRDLVGPENLEISVGFGGVSPSSYTINTVYLWTAGPEECVLRVALKRDAGIRVAQLQEQLRQALPERLGRWLRKELVKEGMPEAEIERQVRALQFGFEPADIVNEVMSFGSGKPIEVAISGPEFAKSRAYAALVREQLAKIPSLRDLQYVQSLDYPTIDVQVDREKAGASGVTTDEVARSLVSATSSSRFIVPNYWRDPKNGVSYQVQVEIPQLRMDSIKEMELVPVKHTENGKILLRDVASLTPSTMPGEYDRYNMRRVVSMTANIQGEDLGRVARHIDEAIKLAGEPPRGVTVSIRGQVVPMEQMFRGLGIGLGVAIVVIFLLLTAYFQSFRLALIALATVPAVLSGVVIALAVTGTTINIQSFMGSIMAVGVAVANAILLVTFAERARLAGADAAAAAVEGAQSRLRPIMMTSMAMIAGMLPMALGLGDGGDQTAPLGRAVIGGLAAATLATLLVLPTVFALVQRISGRGSASVFPLDPASRFYVAGAAAETAALGGDASPVHPFSQ